MMEGSKAYIPESFSACALYSSRLKLGHVTWRLLTCNSPACEDASLSGLLGPRLAATKNTANKVPVRKISSFIHAPE